MNPINFPESNVTYAKDQPPYIPMPVYRDLNDPEVRLVACWKLTLRERIKLLFTGKLWHTILTFKQPLQPQLLTLDKPEMQPVENAMPPIGIPGGPQTNEPPMLPNKELHKISLAECREKAEEYFQDPVQFKAKGRIHYVVDKGTQMIFGSGDCYAAALVDAMGRMEARKKRAIAVHEASQQENKP